MSLKVEEVKLFKNFEDIEGEHLISLPFLLISEGGILATLFTIILFKRALFGFLFYYDRLLEEIHIIIGPLYIKLSK